MRIWQVLAKDFLKRRSVERIDVNGALRIGRMKGLASTGWVGALLAVAGLLMFGVSLAQEAHSARSNTLAHFGT
jgi:hypothetical protein